MRESKRYQSKRLGFSMIEIVAAMGIMGALSAILVPLVGQNISASMVARARAESKQIAGAIGTLRADTGQAPTGQGTLTSDLLSKGDGLPTGEHIKDHLYYNSAYDYPHWNGPYLAYESIEDPWGEAYHVTVAGYCPDAAVDSYVWVVSPGPNQSLSTTVLTAPQEYDSTQPSKLVGSPAAGDVGVLILSNLSNDGAMVPTCLTYE